MARISALKLTTILLISIIMASFRLWTSIRCSIVPNYDILPISKKNSAITEVLPSCSNTFLAYLSNGADPVSFNSGILLQRFACVQMDIIFVWLINVYCYFLCFGREILISEV